MVKPTINAIFLSELGAEQLPLAFILVALVAAATSYFYNKIVKRFSLKLITTFTLTFFSLSFVLYGTLLHFDLLGSIMLFAYYLVVAIFAVLTTSQFWIIANMVFNAREAKRLFGFIGAGAIAGGIFGGYLTSILAPNFGNITVIFTASILILCCIPILRNIWKLRIGKLNRFVRQQRKSQSEASISPFKQIKASPHLTYLALIVGIGVIMAKMVDYQFSDFANRSIPDSDDLASFFAFWFSTFNVLALVIQLFITNRLLARLGVTTNLLLLPLGIALGCLLFLTFPELWVLIIIKGIDGSFKQSINKAAVELSILPIPITVKKDAKYFIDVVVDSLATGLAGITLIFVIRKFQLSTSYVTVIILFLLFVWMLLIYKLREAYFDSFRKNIRSAIVETKKKNRNKKRRTNESTIEILTQGSEEEILTLLDRFGEIRITSFKPYIVKLLYHQSPKVIAAAIKQLYSYKKGTAVDRVKELIDYKDDEVVYQAMEYLLNHTLINDQNIYNSYLNHDTDYIAGAALLVLAKDASANPNLGKKYRLDSLIKKRINDLSQGDNDLRKEEIAALLITIAHSKQPIFYSFISAHFNNKDPYVVKHSIKAAGLTSHEFFLDYLIDFLAIKEYRKSAAKALQLYGSSISKAILDLERAESIEPQVKPYIPAVIEKFANTEAYQVLVGLASSKDFSTRLAAVKSLLKLKDNHSHFSVNQGKITKLILKESTYYKNSIKAIAAIRENMYKVVPIDLDHDDRSTDLHIARENLEVLLKEQLDQSLESIFNLLSLKYDKADIETAYFGLKSDSQDTRINAVEFLDNLLQIKLKLNLLPLIEYHLFETLNDKFEFSDGQKLTESQALSMLMENRGVKMKLAVLKILNHLADSSFVPKVQELRSHRNKRVQSAARKTLLAIEQYLLVD